MNGSLVFQWILIVTLIFGAIAMIIWLVWLYQRNKDENKLPPNPNIVIHFMPDDTDGYAIGLELKCTKGKGGRCLEEFLPMDYDTEKEDKPKTQKLIVGKGKRVVIGKSSQSRRREPIYLLPESVSDLPEEMGENIVGKMLVRLLTEINVNNTLTTIFEGAIERISQIKSSRPLGEASREELGFLQQQIMVMAKNMESGDNAFTKKKGENKDGNKN